jgi:hypothetical protein
MVALMVVFREGFAGLTVGMGHESAFGSVRHLLLGLGGALIVPWLFVSVGLAERKEMKP